MLLSHDYVEQIGDLAQYTGSIEGFNKLKGVLLRSQCLSQNNKSVLESIFMRKQKGNESADQYGNALRSLAEGVINAESELKKLFCFGLRDPKLREKVAYYNNSTSNENSSLDEVIAFATDKEKCWKLTANYLRSSGSDYSDNSASPRVKFNDQPQETSRSQQRNFSNANQRFPPQDHRTKIQRNDLNRPQCRNCNCYGHYQKDCPKQAPLAQLSPPALTQNLVPPPNQAFNGNNYNAAMFYPRSSPQNKRFPARKAKSNDPLKLNCEYSLE